jgi:hypothetical protein
MPLSLDDAAFFTGDHYTSSAGKSPYLIRAVYGHGGTGRYVLSQRDTSLLVQHGSLGHTTVRNNSALIVSLPFTPTEVYTEISIAE